MKDTKKLVMMALGIAINVVLGTVVSYLKIPFLYLDTLGTVYIVALFGPLAAAIVGFITNVVIAITTGSAASVAFGIVNIVVGVISGLIFKKYGVNYITGFIVGIILAFVAPMIGTPISLLIYGGLDFNATDIMKVYINKLVDNFALSVYSTKVLSNLIDKVLTALIAVLIYLKTKRVFDE
ncbi:MAG: ECF transporter S component [Bacilli bacterium]